jgi:hypothetical protein
MKTVWLKNKTDFTKTDNCGNNPPDIPLYRRKGDNGVICLQSNNNGCLACSE